MLRIFVFDELYSVKLRLEGMLTERTVPLLVQRWMEVRGGLRERKAILDLGDVVEMDEAGVRALSWLLGTGVRIGYAHPNLRSLIEPLICNQRGARQFATWLGGRLHLTGCAERWDSTKCRVCRLICAFLPAALCPCGCRTA